MAFTKTCKYCNLVKISWDDTKGQYVEVVTREQHTKDRCQEAQNKGGTNSIQQSNTKTDDIKAAQKQRKAENDALIVALRNLTKAIVYTQADKEGANAKDIMSAMGFEEYRDEQQDQVV